MSPDERLERRKSGRGKRRQRRVTYFFGTNVSRSYTVYDGSVWTLQRALVERMFVSTHDTEDGSLDKPHVPGDGAVYRTLAPAFDAIAKRKKHLTPMTDQEFVSSRGRKRAAYEQALIVFRRRGWREKDSYVSFFVKAEKTYRGRRKPDPVPRVISPRSKVYNIAVGRYIAPLESVLFKVINDMFGEVVVAKGLNASQRGELCAQKWAAVQEPCALGGDIHRMDQHVCVEALEWGHDVYDLFFRSPTLRRLLLMQLENRGWGRCYDGCLRIVLEGRRMSGDMDTSLGNILMCCSVLYCIRELVGYFSPLNDGDDWIVVITRALLPEFQRTATATFKECGLPLGLEAPVSHVEHMDFCQARPVFDGTRWTVVRDPRICLDKDACTLKPVRNKADWNILRNSVGLCGLALAGHMPIYCEFYEALRRGAGERVDKDQTPSGFKMLAKGMNMRGVKVTPEARASFWQAFGITPDEQHAVEAYYRQLNPVWRPPAEYGGQVEGRVGLAVGSFD